MLNEDFILKRIEPHLNSKRELSEFEFFALFSSLTLREQYVVINIMIAHDIEYVDEKDEESALLDNISELSRIEPTLDIKKLRNLKNEQLCVMAQLGDQNAFAALLDKNKRFVYQLAIKLHGQFRQSTLTFEDLFQEGNLGLIKAVGKFDPAKDYAFLTYCWHWVRQHIIRAIIDTGYIIRIPVHVFDRLIKFNGLRGRHPEADVSELMKLMQESGEQVTIDNIMKYIMWSDYYLNTTSLNALVGEDDDSEIQDLIPDEKSLSTEADVSARLLCADIREVLSTLNKREEEVLRLRYGLDTGVSKTLEVVGQEFGVTRERIRQIESKSLKKLRHPSRAKKLWAYYEGE